MLFRSLGQVTHLIQDASVPAHVRNDPHLSITGLGDADWYEDWTEENGSLATQFINLSPFKPPLSIFTPTGDARAPVPIARLIDADRFFGTNTSALKSLELGISEYTNGNFLSKGTLFLDFALPRVDGLDLLNPVVEPIGTRWRRYFSKTSNDGEPVRRFVAEGMLWRTLQAARSAPPPSGGWTMDDRVQEDYARLLLPRAVGYSAGLLDYFFRGRLKGLLLRVEGAPATFGLPPYTVQLRLTNDSTEPMQGKFTLYADKPDGTRAQLAEWAQKTFAPGETQDLSFIAPVGFDVVQQFVVVFHGRLGEEDGAVVGKVIGPAKFLEKWDLGLTGNHPWAHSTEAAVLGTNPDNGVSTLAVLDGQLVMDNNRLAGSSQARFNQSFVGPLHRNGILHRDFQDVLPVPITSRTNIEVKFDSTVNQQPDCGPAGTCAWQVLELEFSGQRLIQIAVPGQGIGRPQFRGAYIEANPKVPQRFNIHDIFTQVGIPLDNLVLGSISLVQQLAQFSKPPLNLVTPDPLARQQRTMVDYIRVSDEANTDPTTDPDADLDGDGDGLPDNGSLPPSIVLVSPVAGTTVLEGSLVDLRANTTNDSQIVALEFIVNGVSEFVHTSPPFATQYLVPLGGTQLHITAVATDLFGRTSTATAALIVQADPPPTVVITSPAQGTAVIAGSEVTFTAEAADNIWISGFVWTVNGSPQTTIFDPPYQGSVIVPSGATAFTIEAAAQDNLGRISRAVRTFPVILDPGTTIVGRVLGTDGQPFAGANVTVAGKFTGRSQADGAFSIPGVPTVRPIVAVAAALVGVSTLQGDSNPVAPVAGGITNVGDILMNAIELYPGRKLLVGDAPWSVTTGDLNADGKLDLITANSESDDISVLLGSGDGTFREQRRYAVGSFPISVAVADLNGDGKLDVITANGSGSSNDISVLLGNGDGTLQTQQRFSAGDFPVSVAIADLNGDGFPDIVTANEGSDDISVLLGNGNGTFQAQRRFAAGSFPQFVAVADVNNDGYFDLVAAIDSTDILVLLGNGDGTFQAQQSFPVGQFPYAVALGDVNGDGFVDIVTANGNSDDISILLGSGGGLFQAPRRFDAGNFPQLVTIGDLNNDGWPDLVTSNGFSNDVSVLLGIGDGIFQSQRRFAAGSFPGSASIADLNGDGLPDIATANLESDDVSILLSNGDGTFLDRPQPALMASNNIPSSIAAGDSNGDGNIDLVVADGASNRVVILLNKGNGTFRNPRSFETGAFPIAVAVADLNGDGFADVVTANADSNDISVLLSNGEEDGVAAFQPQLRLAVGNLPFAVAVGDLNRDGFPDLMTANGDSSDVSIMLGNGDGTFQSQQLFVAGNFPIAVAATDLNGDGFLDVVTANIDSDDVSVLIGNGDGTFQVHRRYPAGEYPGSIAIADVNRDGIPDIITANESNDVSVLLGNGNGTFQAQRRFAAGDLPYFVSVTDVNGDGLADIITANVESDDISVLLGNGDGTFQAVRAFATGGQDPVSVIVVDVNGDGKPDLAVGNNSHLFGGVSVLLHH